MAYSPKAWAESDPITPTDLNRIETGVDDVTDDVDTHLAAHLEAWKEIGGSGNPAFTNNWSNYGSGSTAAFRKNGDGMVSLKGFIKHSTGTANPTTAAFTLPEGYRPTTTLILSATIALSTGMVGARIVVGTDGTVRPDRAGATEILWVTLDGLSFHTT